MLALPCARAIQCVHVLTHSPHSDLSDPQLSVAVKQIFNHMTAKDACLSAQGSTGTLYSSQVCLKACLRAI